MIAPVLSEKTTWEEDRDWRDKLHGRLLNDVFRTTQGMYNKKLGHDANNLLAKQDIWNKEYKDRADAFTALGDDNSRKELENEYYEKEKINPYEIDSELRKINERAARSSNPYNVS